MRSITTLDTMPLSASSTVNHDIIIVGGGFSGVCLAYHILRLAQTEKLGRRLSCVLVELKPEIGSGLAYLSNGDRHLLNVPVSKMSISEGQFDSFSVWLTKHAPHYPDTSFVPRYYFRQYLQDSLTEAVRNADRQVDFYILRDEVMHVREDAPSHYELCLRSGQQLHGSTVVLALGNILDSSLVAKEHGGENRGYQPVLRNPWNLDHYSNLPQEKSIAILGAGLSAVDTILQAEAMGFLGKYTVISRHGLLPRAHPSENIEVSDSLKLWAKDLCNSPRTLRTLLREFRSQLNRGPDPHQVVWPQVIEALRPHLQHLWAKLKQREKQCFIRHLRALWDVHRHRSPATSIALLDDLHQSQRLTICRGTICEVREASERIEVIVRERGKTYLSSFLYDAAFSCMGPCSNIAKGYSPLLHQLITHGLAVPDALLLGLSTTTDGELYARANQVQRNLFTLGPLRRGELWETTAVREIRGQASSLAEAIFQRLPDRLLEINPVQSFAV